MILYHHTICPFSRQIRILLQEKQLPFELRKENYWEHSNELAMLNPAFELPILIDGNNIICHISAICEYLEEVYDNQFLHNKTEAEKAEIRRISAWFNYKFYNEVTKYVINERIIKFLLKKGEPSSDVLRAAKTNIYYHLDYIGFLTANHRWLSGDTLTIADFAAAAQLSILDYFNDIPWEHNQHSKEWYALIKSRPSFRNILNDLIPGFIPPKHYLNCDF